jgi:hypothetical protein
MEFNGKSPNGLNQNSINSVSLFVSGSSILTATSESVSVVGKLSGSAVQTYQIGTPNGATLQVNANTQFSGSVSASTFIGDGSGITNINASSIGDLDRIKSGSAQAIISPNLGLVVNTNTTVSGSLNISGSENINGGNLNIVSGGINITAPDTSISITATTNGRTIAITPSNGRIDSTNVDLYLNRTSNQNVQIAAGLGNVGIRKVPTTQFDVSGSTFISGALKVTGSQDLIGNLSVIGNETITGNLTVSGKIQATELFATYISSSIIYSSGSNKFGDASNDKQEITGSLGISGSLLVSGSIKFDSTNVATDNSTQEFLVLNTTGVVGINNILAIL